ncbi:MAG TPA: inositol monophosphatase family protein, partial [Terriglobales bacterium]|nr:inositol monophosphatase family protein [Terriglobales bacterium]
DSGVSYNGKHVQVSRRASLNGAAVLASRSEVKRGEWKQFENAPFTIRPIGSVAYKLALVSAGLADATFTLTPKHEWDVAAGAALVERAGGVVRTLDSSTLRCNSTSPLISGLLACGPNLEKELLAIISDRLPAAARQ